MKIKLILFGIIFLAAFLRFYSISSNPPSLTWDEVAWGYNAYTLGIDGKDEFGRFLPITYIESFGDFKPPTYAYLSVLPVKIFGLNEFSTRFASAFLGTLSVLLTYILVQALFYKENKNFRTVLALASSIVLTISPWHILLSRAAFEANVATFFIMLGVTAFLLAFQKNRWYLLLSIISFIISTYTFNTSRIVSPLILFFLSIVYVKKLYKIKTVVLTSTIIGVILIFPLALFLRTPQAQLRFQEVNIFNDSAIITRVNSQIAADNNAWWSKIIHNRRLTFGVEFLKHYLDHFNPSFLFIKGDINPKFSIQDVGQLYVIELPFLLIGSFMLFKQKRSFWWIIPTWLIIGIIPAATARETPHALRIETTLPTFQILVAYGITIVGYYLYQSKNKITIFLLSIFILFYGINFLYFIHNYFTYYPKEYAADWQYGHKEAILYAKSEEKNYDKIFIAGVLGRPYIYTLFYTQYDPEEFRQTAKIQREVYGFVHVNAFGKYVFNDIKPEYFKQTDKTLYIVGPRQVPTGAMIKKKFYLPNGKEALVAYE